MNDEEFEIITVEPLEYTKELYTDILLVLDSREAVSSARDRLTFYFKARGVELDTAPVTGSSKIYLGSSLCD